MERILGAISRFKGNPLLFALVAFALVKGIILALLIPPFQIPDETTHYDYAVYLSRIDLIGFIGGRYQFSEMELGAVVTREVLKLMGEAEVSRIGSNPRERVRVGLWGIIKKTRDFRNKTSSGSIAHRKRAGGAFNYPPFYYFLISLFLRGADFLDMNIAVKFVMARLITFGLFLLSLFYAYKSLEIIGFHRYVLMTLMTLIALEPQLSWFSVSIQPDVMVLLLINICFYLVLRFVSRLKIKDFYLFHLFAGLLLLTKVHFFLSVYFPILFFFAVALKKKQTHPLQALRPWIIGISMLAVTGGWWYIRSYILFHNPAGYISIEQSDGSIFDNLRVWAFSMVPRMVGQFWGRWGLSAHSYPLWTYLVFLFLSVLPAFYWAIRFFSSLKERKGDSALGTSLSNVRPFLLLPFVFTFGFFILEMAAIAVFYSPEKNNQARHWLPFILPIVLYLAGFYEDWSFRSSGSGSPSKEYKLRLIAYGYVALFLVFDIWMVMLNWQRYYGPV